MIIINDTFYKMAENIEELKELGIENVIMLTGDSESAAKSSAKALGITQYRSQVLPEDKSRIVEELKAEIAEELHTYLDFCDKASSYKEQFAKFYMEDAKVSLETEMAALEESKAALEETQKELEVKRDEANELLAELVAKGEEYQVLVDEAEEVVKTSFFAIAVKNDVVCIRTFEFMDLIVK